MPISGIEPKTQIYKIRVMPFNYTGLLFVLMFININANGNRTRLSCVKGKCINRYTIASLYIQAKTGIEPSDFGS